MEKFSSSMQLTRAADYAVRVMIHLATLTDNERAMLPALADATGAPHSFLSKVLARGRQASVREVIEAIDGPIMLNVCLTHGQSCNRKSWCPAHPVWVKAQRAMLDVLDGATIADLALQAAAPSPYHLELNSSTVD
jgi:DNA-binding IscR family transcriptional regulator